MTDADTGVPSHFGNPLVEQRELLAGTRVVQIGSRGVITITGPDRLSWLDSLTSQSLQRLAPGESAETLLLDPSGRVEYSAGVLDDGETAWLFVESSAVEPFAAWLDRMRFMLRVEVADRTADFAVFGWFAEGGSDMALPVAAPSGIPLVWVDPWREIAAGGVGYADESAHPAHDWTFREALVALADVAAVASSDVAPAGTLALEALRIAAWRPRLGAETDERTIPHELDWLRSAVHLEKGCYRGQETVAKVHNLGHPPRRLVMLHLDGSDNVVPGHGSIVFDGAPSLDTSKEVGSITSSGTHFELGPIALAVVKRSVDVAATLSVTAADGTIVAAAQEVVVPPSAGAAASVPRLPRLGAVRR